LKISVLLYSPVGEKNTSNLTNQLVGFVMFTCAKIVMRDIHLAPITFQHLRSWPPFKMPTYIVTIE
jgi:hypothetical protein